MSQIVEELRNYKVCGASILLYTSSAMCIRVACEARPDLFLTFLDVVYFEGATLWIGVNFCVGDSNERDGILHQAGLDTVPVEQYKLYETVTQSDKVRIIAKNIKITEDFPSEFHFTQPEG